ncbi:hypothetical protein [Streptomyces sp. NPDC005009]
MSGTDVLSMLSPTGAGQRWTAALLAVVLIALDLLWSAQAFDRGRVTTSPVRGTAVLVRDETAEPACHAATAVGAAVMFVLLL